MLGKNSYAIDAADLGFPKSVFIAISGHVEPDEISASPNLRIRIIAERERGGGGSLSRCHRPFDIGGYLVGASSVTSLFSCFL